MARLSFTPVKFAFELRVSVAPRGTSTEDCCFRQRATAVGIPQQSRLIFLIRGLHVHGSNDRNCCPVLLFQVSYTPIQLFNRSCAINGSSIFYLLFCPFFSRSPSSRIFQDFIFKRRPANTRYLARSSRHPCHG